jgi:hypothetical protein
MYTTQGDYVCPSSQQNSIETFYADPSTPQAPPPPPPSTPQAPPPPSPSPACNPLNSKLVKYNNMITTTCYKNNAFDTSSKNCKSILGNIAYDNCTNSNNSSILSCVLPGLPRIGKMVSCPNDVPAKVNAAYSQLQTNYKAYPKDACFDKLLSEVLPCSAPKT